MMKIAGLKSMIWRTVDSHRDKGCIYYRAVYRAQMSFISISERNFKQNVTLSVACKFIHFSAHDTCVPSRGGGAAVKGRPIAGLLS